MSESDGEGRGGKPGLSRRGFLTSMGAGAVTAVIPAHLAGSPIPVRYLSVEGLFDA